MHHILKSEMAAYINTLVSNRIIQRENVTHKNWENVKKLVEELSGTDKYNDYTYDHIYPNIYIYLEKLRRGVKNQENIKRENQENLENLKNIIKNRVWGDFPIENPKDIREDNLANISIVCFHKYAY